MPSPRRELGTMSTTMVAYRVVAIPNPMPWYDQSVIMFESLDQDIRGQKELMSYLESGMSYSDMFSSRLFKIDHLFREQNQYFFPYNLDISSSGFKYDKAAKEEGLKVYQATAYDMPPRFDTIHSFIQEYGQYNKNISSYGYIENMYRNFVYTYYLQVPKGILGRFSKDFPIRQVQTEEERQQFITDLQQYFQNHYTYTRSPGRVPKGKDFVSYFLNESHVAIPYMKKIFSFIDHKSFWLTFMDTEGVILKLIGTPKMLEELKATGLIEGSNRGEDAPYCGLFHLVYKLKKPFMLVATEHDDIVVVFLGVFTSYIFRN